MEKKESTKSINLIDALLSKDKSDFLEKKEEIEISSLSRMFGTAVIVEMRRMSLAQEAELEEYGYKMRIVEDSKDGKLQLDEQMRKRKLMTLVYSIYYSGERLFSNSDLMSKYGVGTPAELVSVILTPDEIDTLYSAYDDLVNVVPKADELKN